MASPDRNRIVVNRSEAIARGDVASPESRSADLADRAAELYDRANPVEDGDYIPAPWEHDDIGGAATTGAAKQLFAASYKRWNPEVPYPQIVPSNTSNEDRPRTRAMGYDPENQIIRITFREGAVYEYYGVPPQVWTAISASDSPGRFINDAGLDVYFDYRRMRSLE